MDKPRPTLAAWWRSLTIANMRWHFYIGSGGNTYGDVVIWIGALYVAWNWGRPYPLDWYRDVALTETPSAP